MPASRHVEKALAAFVDAARTAFGDALRAIVLFGSAAEDRLRATSDVNLIVVLDSFAPERARALGDAARFARVALRLAPMYVTTRELPQAAEAFAVKFADVKRRHRVLFGNDPFAALTVSRDAEARRLRQVLLNLVLRLREQYVRVAGDDAVAAGVLAETAGPLRASAAALRELQGRGVTSGREALADVARELAPGSAALLEEIARVRDGGALAPGRGAGAWADLLQLVDAMHRAAEEAGA